MNHPTEPIRELVPYDLGGEGPYRHDVRAPRTPRMSRLFPALSGRSMRSESGQGVVEFALVLPLLAMLIWVFILFGKALYYYVDLTHVANEGARLAAVNQPQSGSNLAQTICNQFGTNSELYKGSGTVSPANVTISYPTSSKQVGQPVKVDVKTTYKWFPFMGLANITIDGSATMRIEQDNTNNALLANGTCS